MRWSKARRLFSLALCGTLLLATAAACGSKEDESTSIVEETPVSSYVEPGEPVSDFDVSTSAFLTGLEKGADYPEAQRPVAVMVNNVMGSRPTMGLSEASILYEIKVEAGITRFMAVYEDYNTMPTVGGIRSARDQFLQMIIPFRMFFVHDGPSQNQPTVTMLNTYNYWDYDLQPNQGIAFRRDRPGMAYEYTEYTSGEKIAAAIEKLDRDATREGDSPIFNFVPYNQAKRVLENSTTEIAVVHSDSYRTFFEYDASTGKYMMSQRDSGGVTPTIDEGNNQQLGFDNVLVLFAPMSLYDDNYLVKVDYSGGAGYYFSNGGWEVVLWNKGGPDTALQLYNSDKSGEPAYLNPGTSYITFVDDNQLESFDEVLKAGSASSAAAGGTVNENESDID